MAPKSLCVDASFMVRLVTSTSPDSSFDKCWEEWQQTEAAIAVPTLI